MIREREYTRAQKETGRGKEWGNGDAKWREREREIAAATTTVSAKKKKGKAKEKKTRKEKEKRKKRKTTAGHLKSTDPFKVTVITEPTNHSRRIGICSRLTFSRSALNFCDLVVMRYPVKAIYINKRTRARASLINCKVQRAR